MISIIVAMTKKRVIGKNHKLPWHIGDDLKNFKKLTKGSVVIMGRKTFESIGKPLPERINIVLSSSLKCVEGIIVCKTISEALQTAQSFNSEVFIIGGGSVYAEAVPLAEKLYVSYIKGDYDGDTFFPEFDEQQWSVQERIDYPEFELVVYARKHGAA